MIPSLKKKTPRMKRSNTEHNPMTQNNTRFKRLLLTGAGLRRGGGAIISRLIALHLQGALPGTRPDLPKLQPGNAPAAWAQLSDRPNRAALPLSVQPLQIDCYNFQAFCAVRRPSAP